MSFTLKRLRSRPVMSKFSESVRYLCGDKHLRMVVLALILGSVTITWFTNRCLESLSSQATSSSQPAKPQNESYFSRWWNSQRQTIACKSCGQSVCTVRVYPCAPPVNTEAQCTNCGTTANYQVIYEHTVKVHCGHSHRDASYLATFPCQAGVKQAAEYCCPSRHSRLVTFQCSH